MRSGAPVVNVSQAGEDAGGRVEGRITPTLLRLPSARITVWLTHLPSK